jgi:hypothetical protein
VAKSGRRTKPGARRGRKKVREEEGDSSLPSSSREEVGGGVDAKAGDFDGERERREARDRKEERHARSTRLVLL